MKNGKNKIKTGTVKTFEHTEHLRYDFTDKEKAEMSLDMANNIRMKNFKDSERQSVVSQFKADLDSLQSKIDSASEKVSSGFEFRGIKCETKIDYTLNRKTTVRLDSGEIVKEGPIPESERQIEIAPTK